ncbi:proteasome regulatory particle subunit [Moniliophthora roreri]|uniref:Putative diphenol oxidase-A2 n=1 Tax=Moniliophthora roreri TaxID=221103 RepID=A0A0W0G1Q0_MONRR|nr:proteasome regulatory particle subunit [Moniliophthora roreri]
MPDVEMKPAESSKDTKEEKKEEEKKEESKKEEPKTPLAEIKSNAVLIDRAVLTLEPRFTHRVLRTLTALRKKVDESILKNAIEQLYPKDSSVKTTLLSWIPAASSSATMEVDSTTTTAPAPVPPTAEPVPELDVYLRLLILYQLLKSKSSYGKAKELANETVDKMHRLNRRSMDPIAAKIWMAVERVYELRGELAEARVIFLAAQRTAALRRDSSTEAALLNCLLRSYITYSLYDQADKLVSKTTFPSSAPNNQFARYHYYLGRIKAVQLNYSDAHMNLQQAIRRAPPPTMAPGFFQAVHKLNVVVELLMGDIPDRSIFRHKVLEKALVGYFELVKGVRTGSLSQFLSTVAKHSATFQADHTHTLIVRLRQNVIKTGIRQLSLSYSLISLKDICVKLHLDSEEDAEYIVGKAIRDGVIEGRMVHEQGWMACKGAGGAKGQNAYGNNVAEAFQRRIGYCLELHNQSVKAMRYPLNAHRKELAAAEGAREREKELAKEIQEGDLDEDDLGGEF